MQTKKTFDSKYFKGFSGDKYQVVSVDDVQSNLQIQDVQDRYKDRLIAFRYNVQSGIAEFLIVK